MSSTDRHVLVIGAGLAGAAISAALARLGWRVQLFDRASGPAQAASSLPVGMLSPHVTRAPTPLSRLSALGVACTRAELERLVPVGAGWQPTEVDNRGHDAGRHAAALVRPAALVQAWLQETADLQRLDAHWNCPVDAIEPVHGGWRACDAAGRTMAEAPHVVVAAALDSLRLLVPHGAPATLPLRPVQGQMSLAALDGPPLAERPQRDNGVFVPDYADSGLPPQWPARIWAMGSTYERGASHTDVRRDAHRRNEAALRALVPEAADRMGRLARDGRLAGWAQVRCASLDRLPLAGALPDLSAWAARRAASRARPPLSDVPRLAGLHTLTALGSRGLSLAAWCAQTMACEMDGRATEAPPDLLQAVDPARFAWRQSRRLPA